MKQIVFKCSENMNEFEEVVEFEDDVTEEEITEAFSEWVWNEVGDHYTWFPKEDA